MKNRMAILVMVILILGLSGCAANGQAAVTQGAPAAGGQAPGAEDQPIQGERGEMSQAMKLALGILKLEGTPNAVTAEQAAQLLPLWKAARSLNGSQTAASEEIQAVFNQIQKGITADQMAAIDAMQLSPGDMQTVFKELGLELSGPAQGDPSIQSTMQAARATAIAGGQAVGPGQGQGGGFGGPPGGGGPLGGGLGGPPAGGDSGLSDEARATAMAQRGARGARVGLPTGLIEAVIETLEAK